MVSLIGPVWPLSPLPLQEKLVTPAGSGSLTVTLVAVLGPVLATTMVYVVVPPGAAVAAASVLVTPTSTAEAAGMSVVLSVDELLAVLTSPVAVTVAVLLSVPVAAALMVPFTM